MAEVDAAARQGVGAAVPNGNATPRPQRQNAAIPAAAAAANVVGRDPLINVRDRLFHTLFYRLTLAYARACPRSMRRVIETMILIKVETEKEYFISPLIIYVYLWFRFRRLSASSCSSTSTSSLPAIPSTVWKTSRRRGRETES